MALSRIRVLNDQTINKIAAGEVIENPASVVKELVENSLDAGATSICVEIQGGGRQLIRLSDDGCGMSHDDALLCLERHATSKICEVEDIQDLLTMGFRGEAIPSIAAISKLTLLTCPRLEGEKKEEGTLILVEGGRIISCSSAARSPGTTIEVKSLFFNVPVRRKFQKSPAFDSQEILKMLGLLALAYPAVQFELISDQKSLLKTPLSPQPLSFHDLLGKRLESVLGKEHASALLPLKFQKSSFELEGFIGSPTSHKPNRTGQHLFINQRLVVSPLIAAAVREGYGTMLPNHRYPLFVLHLRMPGSLLDVNVHPQKKEVRLRQEHQLKEIIIEAIQTALRREQKQPHTLTHEEVVPIPPFWAPYASLLSPNSSFSPTVEEQWEYQPVPPKNPFPALDPASATFNQLSSDSEHSAYSLCDNLIAPSPKPIPPLTPSLLDSHTKPSIPPILATLLGYCILDPFHLNEKLFGHSIHKRQGGLALLDQRAAYARIHYEQLLKRSAMKETQPLLIPLTLQLTTSESEAIREHLLLLNQMGFGLREFGEQTFVLDAFPHFLKQDQLQTCLHLLTQDLVEMQTSRRLQMQKEEQLALAACRASLPTTKQLTIEEAQGLVQQLVACELSTQCPMGKPICLYLAPEDIAKWFQKLC
jgi:DNA mismatch repair protein MutL